MFVNEALKDLSLNQLDSNDSALNVTPMKFRPENWLSSTPNLKNRQTIDTDQIYWVTDKTTFTTGNLQEIEDEISFEQIGGCHKAKEDLKAFLINPLKISEVPHCNSFLLYGVSGTGKTLLGKSLKFETNLTTHFILPSDADVKQRVTELTRNCQRSQPALIVADNFDAFVEGKGKESQNLQTFWCSTLDSLRGTPMVFVAITNRLENIDSRLRSRFDVEVEVMVPNEVERKEILSQLIHRFNHCLTDSDSEVVSGKAHGYTGADLNAVCRQAASLAMRY